MPTIKPPVESMLKLLLVKTFYNVETLFNTLHTLFFSWVQSGSVALCSTCCCFICL